MPAYSPARKRIPKRYLNFPNARRKRTKRRRISLPPHRRGPDTFFLLLTKSCKRWPMIYVVTRRRIRHGWMRFPEYRILQVRGGEKKKGKRVIKFRESY
jgi:hypothetical protein